MPLQQSALTTWPVVQAALGHSDAAQQARTERLIDSVSVAMAQEIGRTVQRTAGIVERHGSDGFPRLFLRRLPVSSISAIVRLAQDGSIAETFTTTSYEIENASLGWVYREGGWPATGEPKGGFTPGIQSRGPPRESIRVTYTAGYITPYQSSTEGGAVGTRDLPFDLEEACIQSVIALANRYGSEHNITTNAVTDRQTTWEPIKGGLLLPMTIAVCERYRTVV